MSIWPTYADPKKSAIALPDSLLEISYVHVSELLVSVLGLHDHVGVLHLPLGSKFKTEYKLWMTALMTDTLLQGWVYAYLLELHREFKYRFGYGLLEPTLDVMNDHSHVGITTVKTWNATVDFYVGPDEHLQTSASIAYRKWLVYDLSNKLQWTNRVPPPGWTHGLKKLQSIADTY